MTLTASAQPTAPQAAHLLPRFQSFFMGGFECATHVRQDRRRVDVLAAMRHDTRAEADYHLLAQAGIRTVRDGLRWHRIEATRGTYDWSSFLPMLQAAHRTGTEVLWDLCHWGVPDWLDPFSAEFPEIFARFARAAAECITSERERAGITGDLWVCAINEISFWSWVGGDTEFFGPFGRGRGPELKRQLAAASIRGLRAVREVLPHARFLQPEPLIHIAPGTRRASTLQAVRAHNEAQFEAWDMLCGRLHPELGGSEDLLDVVGVNYYWNNQWVHGGERAPLGHPRHVPLHTLLQTVAERYKRPIVLTETGVEGDALIGWLGMIGSEVRRAQTLGAAISGICIYPVADYPGWDDSRHAPAGLLALDRRWHHRSLRADLVAELNVQARLLELSAGTQANALGAESNGNCL